MEMEEFISILEQALVEIDYALDAFREFKSFEKYSLPLRKIKFDLEKLIETAEKESEDASKIH